METEELQNYYDNNYHGKIHKNLLDDDDYYWARAEAFHQLYFSRDNVEGKRVLDFGCGLGQASACIKSSEGYDLSAQARQVAEGHGKKVYASIEDIPLRAMTSVFVGMCLSTSPILRLLWGKFIPL